MQIVDETAGHMTQPAGHAVTLYGAADRFRDDQTDPGTILVDGMTHRVHDEIGLHCPHPLTDRGTELGRPRHPVPRR